MRYPTELRGSLLTPTGGCREVVEKYREGYRKGVYIHIAALDRECKCMGGGVHALHSTRPKAYVCREEGASTGATHCEWVM